MNFFKLIIAGLVIGIANVIPGVSGGTMAVVFGVYDRLIGIISLNVKKIFSEWKFWLPLALGMGIGILLFSKVVQFLFEKYPVYTSFFFTGIVAGSIPLVFKKCALQNQDGKSYRIEKAVAICAILGFAVMVIMDFFKANASASDIIQTEFSVELVIKLGIGGALAAIAMIIPGISGSFLLLILGIYATVIGAVADLNIPLLIPIAIGVIIGLLCGASFVRFLMNKYPRATYGAILGLIAGSILAILPIEGLIAFINAGGVMVFVHILISLVCAALGFLIAVKQKAK